ncbi:MAG: beta-xylosidase [Bacteroidetes bacterium]|nr:beta-xylosidase [Bacteroidota bacterium]
MLTTPIKLASLLVLVNGSLLFLAGICALGTAANAQGPAAPAVVVDYTKQGKQVSTFWAHFGYDEPNYTYMKDGKKLLSELAALSPAPVYVRCHNLLTTGDGEAAMKWGSTNAYTEDANGNPVYDWHIVDSIFDTYVSRGMKPLAEIGFMPEALSVHPQPYRHHWKPGVKYDSIYTGWAWPPVSYDKWGRLVEEWVRHCVKKYGEKEVNTWLWEVWNEPNISYWKGKREEYFKLYDYAAAGVKRALPTAKVGGPATTGPSWDVAGMWLKTFLEHCKAGNVPLDFISYHAKGAPRVVDGHVRMNMRPQMKDVGNGFAIVKASAYADLPIYITECDPEGCAACGMTTNPENAYRNGTMYSSYTASSFKKVLDSADKYGVNLAGATSWSFEFENQKWFDGFRDLATNGVDKPVLNVFRMYGMMKGNRIGVDSANVLAAGDGHSMTVMLWNYIDDDLPGPALERVVRLLNVPAKKVRVERFMIDDEHSNSYEVWKKMGSPQSVSDEQYKVLEKAGQLQMPGDVETVTVKSGGVSLPVALPAHGVMMVRVRW